MHQHPTPKDNEGDTSISHKSNFSEDLKNYLEENLEGLDENLRLVNLNSFLSSLNKVKESLNDYLNGNIENRFEEGEKEINDIRTSLDVILKRFNESLKKRDIKGDGENEKC